MLSVAAMQVDNDGVAMPTSVAVWAAVIDSRHHRQRGNDIQAYEDVQQIMLDSEALVADLRREILLVFAPLFDELAPSQLIIYYQGESIPAKRHVKDFITSAGCPFTVNQPSLHCDEPVYKRSPSHGYDIKEMHSEYSHGAYGLVMNAEKNGKEFVTKFFGYTNQQPDTDWILREIDNLTHLVGIEGVVQIEDTFNDTADGMLPNSYQKNNKSRGKVYPVIVLEKLSGGTLYERITSQDTFSERDASVIFKSFITALRDIHYDRNMINCDLKAENLVFKSKDNSVVKIIDFGMAVNLRDREFHYDKNLSSTATFLAPETIYSHRKSNQAMYSRSTDIWQAGCILYFLLTGQYPFTAATASEPSEVEEKAPTKVEERIMKKQYWKLPRDLPRSKEAKDLLQKLLAFDSRQRLTAIDILEHDWITKVDSLPTTDYSKSFDDNIKAEHEVRRAFLRTIHINTKLNESTVTRRAEGSDMPSKAEFLKSAVTALKKYFIACCTGRTIPSNESTAEGSSVTDAMFVIDFEGISLTQYLEFMTKEASLSHLANKELFNRFDQNNNLMVDYLECLVGIVLGEIHDMGEVEDNTDLFATMYFSIIDVYDRHIAEFAVIERFFSYCSQFDARQEVINQFCRQYFTSDQKVTEEEFKAFFRDFIHSEGSGRNS
jgi:serine/threonine protein kinase